MGKYLGAYLGYAFVTIVALSSGLYYYLQDRKEKKNQDKKE